jgi:RHS repeat-associated protein
LQKAQKADLQQFLDQAKLGTASFKEYKTYTYEELQSQINQEADADSTSNDGLVRRPTGVLYFYHPDHLGTSTFLTDINGNTYQFFLNLPFGETMAEQLGGGYYNTPYKFNCKELDAETGLYYYGARYYDPRVSIWMSVDPLAEQGPHIGPYVYCLSNPLNLTDPTGEYPKPSELLKKAGINLNPFVAGFIDGLADASPIGAIGFAYDFATDSNFREQTIEGIKTFMEDPGAALEKIVG